MSRQHASESRYALQIRVPFSSHGIANSKFSAYWWQRIGAQTLCILHRAAKHRAWLRVDDLLVLLSKAHFKDSACLIIALLSASGVPIHHLVRLDFSLRPRDGAPHSRETSTAASTAGRAWLQQKDTSQETRVRSRAPHVVSQHLQAPPALPRTALQTCSASLSQVMALPGVPGAEEPKLTFTLRGLLKDLGLMTCTATPSTCTLVWEAAS